jgi:hypothetical protein
LSAGGSAATCVDVGYKGHHAGRLDRILLFFFLFFCFFVWSLYEVYEAHTKRRNSGLRAGITNTELHYFSFRLLPLRAPIAVSPPPGRSKRSRGIGEEKGNSRRPPSADAPLCQPPPQASGASLRGVVADARRGGKKRRHATTPRAPVARPTAAAPPLPPPPPHCVMTVTGLSSSNLATVSSLILLRCAIREGERQTPAPQAK